MSNIFSLKRVSLPGALSDKGAVVGLNEFASQLRSSAAAAPAGAPTAPVQGAPEQLAKPKLTRERAGQLLVATSGLVKGFEGMTGMKMPLDIPGPKELKEAQRREQSSDDIAAYLMEGRGAAALTALIATGELTPERRLEQQQKGIAEAQANLDAVNDDTRRLTEDMIGMSPEERRANYPWLPPDMSADDLAKTAQSYNSGTVKDAEKRLDVAKKVPPRLEMWAHILETFARSTIQTGTGVVNAGVDALEILGAPLAGWTIKQSDAGRALDDFDRAITKLFPGDEARQLDFATDLAAGGGSFVAFWLGGLFGKAVKLGVAAVSGGLGAASGANAAYEDAERFTDDGLKRLLAYLGGGAIGVSNAAPIDRMFFRANTLTGGLVERMLKTSAAGTGEEFIQELFEAVGNDTWAKIVYDPERVLDPAKWARQAAAGAVIGGAAGGITSLLPQTDTPYGDLSPAEIDAAIDKVFVDEQRALDAQLAAEDPDGATDLDGEGAVEAPAPGTRGEAPAGSAVKAARPDPVKVDQPRGDAVQEIVKPTNVPKAVASNAQETVDEIASLRQAIAEGRKKAAAQEITDAPLRAAAEEVAKRAVPFEKRLDRTAAAFDAAQQTRGRSISEILPEDRETKEYKAWNDADQKFTDFYLSPEGDARTYLKAEDGSAAPVAPASSLAMSDADVGTFSSLLLDAPITEGGVYQIQLTPDEQSRLEAAGIKVSEKAGARTSIPTSEAERILLRRDELVRGLNVAMRAEQQVANPIAQVQLEPTETAPLPSATTSPNPNAVKAARAYTAAAGLPTRRQRDAAPANPARSTRIAQAYADMKHEPADPAVLSSYQALVEEVQAQYAFASAAGPLPAPAEVPVYPPDHPLAPVAEQFWALHRFFGEGLEGAVDPENMWQAHSRLFSASALPAFTAETRGAAAFTEQFGEPAERKVGQLPSWTWQEGVEDTTAYAISAPVETADPAAFRTALASMREASKFGTVTPLYSPAKYAKMRTFLSPDGQSGFALEGEKIVSLFGADPTQLRKIADTAIANGGRTFEGFDTGLPEMMASLGFRETGRKPWVDAYAPKDWPAELGTPDLVSMEWAGSDIEQSVALAPELVRDVDSNGLGYGALTREQMRTMNRAVDQKEWQEALLPVQRLIGTQPTVNDDFREAAQGRTDLALVIHVNGQNYIRDGHHRIAAAADKGDYAVRVRYIDVDALLVPGDAGQADLDLMTGTSTARQPYYAEPTRAPRAEPPGTTSAAVPEDERQTTIGRSLVRLISAPVRQGRLHGKQAKTTMGTYSRNSGVVRIRDAADFSTLAHELGHYLNDHIGGAIERWAVANAPALQRFGVKAYAADISKAPPTTQRREGFAEFFRLYVTNPPSAQRELPQLFSTFEDTLRQADPSLLTGLQRIQRQFQATQAHTSTQALRAMVRTNFREIGINATLKEMQDKGIPTWIEDFTRGFLTQTTDKFRPLRSIVSKVLEEGQKNRGQAIDLAYVDDPRTWAQISANSDAAAMMAIKHGPVPYGGDRPSAPSLRATILTALGLNPNKTPKVIVKETYEAFSNYLVARRVVDEYRRLQLGLIDHMPSRLPLDMNLQAIADLENRYPQFVPAAVMFNDYARALWIKRYEAGLISEEDFKAGDERQFYAPLQRDMSDMLGNDPTSGVQFGRSTLAPGPRFKGSQRDVLDPIAVISDMTYALEREIAENEPKRLLAELAARAGDVGGLVEKIPATEMKAMTVSVVETMRKLAGDDTLSPQDAIDLSSILAGSIAKGNMLSFFRAEQTSTRGGNIIFYWDKGEIAALQLHDGDLGRDVLDLLSGGGREMLPYGIELLAATSGIYRTAIIAHPAYTLANFVRGEFDAWMKVEGYIPFYSGFRGIYHELKQTEVAKSYNRGRGLLGGVGVAAQRNSKMKGDTSSILATGYIKEAFSDRTFEGAAAGFARLTEITETGSRLGAYEVTYNRGVKEGLTHYQANHEAAYIATDMMDYGMHGSRMLAVRRTVPFLNSQIEGFYKFLRTLGGNDVAQRKGLRFALAAYFKDIEGLDLSRTEKAQLRTGRKAWVKMVSLGLLSTLLHFILRDDPDYQDEDEVSRATNWIIPGHYFGGQFGRVIRIPKPFEWAMIANITERGLEFADGDGTAISKMLNSMALTLTPPVAPPAIQSAVEMLANFDFYTMRVIEPQYMKGKPPEMRYNEYTSALARRLGEIAGWSPFMVDHALSGFGATYYRDIGRVFDVVDPRKPQPDLEDLPVFSRFYSDVRGGSLTSSDFYRKAGKTTGQLAQAAGGYASELEKSPASGEAFLRTLDPTARSFALLMKHFEPPAKMLNPYYRVGELAEVIGGMRRSLQSDVGLSDTSDPEDKTLVIALTRGEKAEVDNLLSEISRREMRNLMVQTKTAGWGNKKIMPLQPTLDLLAEVHPAVYEEYMRRVSKAKIYDAETVRQMWPEVQARLMEEGEYAILDDLVIEGEATIP